MIVLEAVLILKARSNVIFIASQSSGVDTVPRRICERWLVTQFVCGPAMLLSLELSLIHRSALHTSLYLIIADPHPSLCAVQLQPARGSILGGTCRRGGCLGNNVWSYVYPRNGLRRRLSVTLAAPDLCLPYVCMLS